MKYLLALCLVVTLVYGDNPICHLKPEAGLCDAYIPSYYYEPETRECKVFIYGGCGGNENRFRTQKKCEETCGGDVEYAETTCHEEADPGNCLGYFPRYYYNKDTKRCEEFIFGGCGGNDNNFETEESCLTTCGEGSRRY